MSLLSCKKDKMTFTNQVVGQPESVYRNSEELHNFFLGNLILYGLVMQNCPSDNDLDADDNHVYRAYVASWH